MRQKNRGLQYYITAVYNIHMDKSVCRPLPRPSCLFLGSVAWREMVAKDVGVRGSDFWIV